MYEYVLYYICIFLGCSFLSILHALVYTYRAVKIINVNLKENMDRRRIVVTVLISLGTFEAAIEFQ